MTVTDFPTMIIALKDAGINQNSVAELCGVPPTTISSIKSGQSADPGYSLGIKIVSLFEEHCPSGKGEITAS